MLPLNTSAPLPMSLASDCKMVAMPHVNNLLGLLLALPSLISYLHQGCQVLVSYLQWPGCRKPSARHDPPLRCRTCLPQLVTSVSAFKMAAPFFFLWNWFLNKCFAGLQLCGCHLPGGGVMTPPSGFQSQPSRCGVLRQFLLPCAAASWCPAPSRGTGPAPWLTAPPRASAAPSGRLGPGAEEEILHSELPGASRFISPPQAAAILHP